MNRFLSKDFLSGVMFIAFGLIALWFGRNLAIFNNIARHTDAGDRVLVIYGAGHGNYLRRLALDSGLYQVRETSDWLSACGAVCEWRAAVPRCSPAR